MRGFVVEACLECLESPKHLPEAVERVLDEPCEFVNLVGWGFGFCRLENLLAGLGAPVARPYRLSSGGRRRHMGRASQAVATCPPDALA